tara:strand:- start:1417 stop:2271 length:855 start_codon:yes stop_codon:yes gene_type:complete
MKLTKEKLKEMIKEELKNSLMEKNVPTDPGKWSYYKSQAKKKFDVYPSAYANAWASKQYKKAGGSWKKGKSESVEEESSTSKVTQEKLQRKLPKSLDMSRDKVRDMYRRYAKKPKLDAKKYVVNKKNNLSSGGNIETKRAVQKEARGTCWVGYQQVGMKKKGDKMVPNCVKEVYEIFYEQDGEGHGYTFEFINDGKLNEAEYQGRKVKLNKPMQGDTKKFKVYVKNEKGNVIKVNFGHGGSSVKGKSMRIRKSNPEARKSFRARHNCDNPGPKTKARYWSCKKW